MRRMNPSWLAVFLCGVVSVACSGGGKVEETTAVTRVEISPAEASLEVGEELPLEVRAFSARGGEVSGFDVAFASSAPDLVSVDEEGVVRALRPGAATITATVSGRSGTMEVVVLDEVHSISIEPDPVELLTQESIQLRATAYDANGKRLEGREFEWSVENERVATVDENGLLTALRREQDTEVIARYRDVEGRARVFVTKAVHSIEIRNATPPVREKSERQLEAIVRDDVGHILEGREVTWRSEDESIATVDSTGLLLGVAPGTVEIFASSGGVETSASVEILPERVHRIEIEPKEAELAVGETQQFTARTFNEAGEELFGRTLRWSVVDPELIDQSYARLAAPIDETGLLTGARPFRGRVEVTVPGDAVKAEADIRIALRMKGVAAGHHHTCALTASGEAWCWGENTWGQTGVSPLSHPLPSPVQTELRFAYIAAGSDHSCGVTQEGEAYCWGKNEFGQLGIGDEEVENSTVPLKVARAEGAVPFEKIYAGDGYSCAIDLNKKAFCWGRNEDGRLGNGQRETSWIPVEVMGEVDEEGVVTPVEFAELSLGSNTMGTRSTMTCGISVDGVGYCWGENEVLDHGIGAGTEPLSSSIPVRLAGGLEFTSISVGALHACGLTKTKEAYCWGRGVAGELGDGVSGVGNHHRKEPHPVESELEFSLIGAGLEQSCALTDTGELFCWGWMEGAESWPEPRRMGGSQDWIFETLSSGDRHFCAIDAENVVFCWGSNFNDQLGNTVGRVRIDTPVRIFPEDPGPF